jgi:hypothetical protein
LTFSQFRSDEAECAERATLPIRETAVIEDLFGGRQNLLAAASAAANRLVNTKILLQGPE